MKDLNIGYLGAFPENDAPIVPSLFRRGRLLHATDGHTVMGPFPTEQEARYVLTLALIKRHRRNIDWSVYFGSIFLISVMCLILVFKH